jgi:hypothetical protein
MVSWGTVEPFNLGEFHFDVEFFLRKNTDLRVANKLGPCRECKGCSFLNRGGVVRKISRTDSFLVAPCPPQLFLLLTEIPSVATVTQPTDQIGAENGADESFA